MRLARHRARQKRLARARRADEQRALGQLCADGGIFVRVVKKVDDLRQGFLRLLLARDIGKGHARLVLRVNFGIRFAEGHGVAGHAAAAPGHPAHQKLPHCEQQKEREDPCQEEVQQRGVLRGDLRAEFHIRVVKTLAEIRIREKAGFVILVFASVVLRQE